MSLNLVLEDVKSGSKASPSLDHLVELTLEKAESARQVCRFLAPIEISLRGGSGARLVGFAELAIHVVYVQPIACFSGRIMAQ